MVDRETGWFVTTDLYFACALVHVHTSEDANDEVTRRIRIDRNGRKVFYLAVSPEEAEADMHAYRDGLLDISNLKAYGQRYSYLSRLCRQLQSSGDIEWNAPPPLEPSHSEEWWASARQAVEQRRAERELRERR
jgi:hypothetical protein